MKITDFLLAHVGENAIAVKVAFVRQILAYKQSFKVPKSPAFLSGIMHAKGGVVPIVNIADALGIKSFDPHPFRVAVVVESAGTRCSFICDGVTEIVSADRFEPLSEKQTGENMFIENTLEHSGNRIDVISIPALLSLVHGNCSIDYPKEQTCK